MLSERIQRVLFAVVESSVGRTGPVGSEFVLKEYGFNMSSATVRNIMAELEEMGYLEQPHTSSGRVPTDKGYRFYVDYIYRAEKDFDDRSIPNLTKRLIAIKNDIEGLLQESIKSLSSQSHYLGVAACFKPSHTTLNRIQLYRYRGKYIASVLFTNEGLIKHKVLNADFPLTQRDLNRISEYLNSEFSGYSIEEIQSVLIRKMSKEKALCDILISKAVSLCREALSYPSCELLVSGVPEFYALPDFSSRIKEIARAIEDKQLIVKLLDGISPKEEGVCVLIGSENPVEELRGLSIVASAYRRGDRPLGTVGVIGPRRMDYLKAIKMVGATARVLTNAISERRL